MAPELIPASVLGAAWGPQKDRMAAAIYFPLFLVLVAGSKHAIYDLPRRSSETRNV
jgi:hypothetical protein